MPQTPLHERHLEIDLLRTLAVLLMVLYHLIYDLTFFYGWSLDPERGGWWLLARGTATLFLLLVGISFALSWERARSRSPGAFLRLYPKYLRRGLLVLACGLLVTLVTFAADPSTYVRFGVLHLIGVGILLLPFFAPLRGWNAAIGAAVLSLGIALRGATASTALLLPLGWMPPFFSSIDYFPLLPWFGVILMGYALGHFVYIRTQWKSTLPTTHYALRTLLWPGRHALLLYLLHQPVLLLLLWLTLGRARIA